MLLGGARQELGGAPIEDDTAVAHEVESVQLAGAEALSYRLGIFVELAGASCALLAAELLGCLLVDSSMTTP